jgi:hypothetical protein
MKVTSAETYLRRALEDWLNRFKPTFRLKTASWPRLNREANDSSIIYAYALFSASGVLEAIPVARRRRPIGSSAVIPDDTNRNPFEPVRLRSSQI